jgi:3-isopropylmalate dehydratase small subunit
MNIHIDVDAKKITCFNSKKGIYETETFAEACLEDSMDESDLQEYFEEKYPHHSVNVIFL